MTRFKVTFETEETSLEKVNEAVKAITEGTGGWTETAKFEGWTFAGLETLPEPKEKPMRRPAFTEGTEKYDLSGIINCEE